MSSISEAPVYITRNHAPIMTDTNGKFQMPHILDVLQRHRRARFEPSVLLLGEPVIQAFFQLIELFERRTPVDG